MQIDIKLLRRLESLSQIKIEKTKENEIIKDLNRFLNFVEILNQLDTKDTKTTFYTLQKGSPFREDIPIDKKEIGKKILKNAPKSIDNFFIVPKIIE